MNIETVKGFKDYIGENAEKRQAIKGILATIFEKYGFELAETPIIEYEDFVRGKNNDDEAVSDIYKLKDKGKRKLALRYEFTFQLKRIAKNIKLPYKRYQIGEVFRDEPANPKRFRQFTQCDVDIVGSSVKDGAEMLAIAKEALDKLKIQNEIYVGNRRLLNEILDKEKIKGDKEKILREIDKLDKLDIEEVRKNLKKLNAENILEILKKPESFFEKYDSYSEIKELRKFCDYYGVKMNFLPSLVRGLSYYNGNVWEIKTKEMKETICGGGSYLFENNQCVGISFGLDRLKILAEVERVKEKILVLSINEDKEAIKLAQKLREKGNNVVMFYGKPSKALDYANAYKINKVIFVGEKEVKKKKFKIKDMESGKERELRI